MDELQFLEERLNQLENINSSLVETETKKIDYPFIEIRSITMTEYDMIKDKLPSGPVNLMIRSEGKLFPFKRVNLNLKTVKILSIVSPDHIIIQKSKEESIDIDDFLDNMLMEGYEQ